MTRNKKSRPAPRDRSRPDRKRRGSNKPRSRGPSGPEEAEWLYGQHTVLEALKNPKRRNECLFLTENAAKRFDEVLRAAKVPSEIVPTGHITRQTGPDAVHQGLLLKTSPLPPVDLQDILERPGPIVVLDQITDPHNVGAVLRSATAFAAAGLVMTARHSPGASAVLAKSASGGLEHVPIAKVTNLAKAIETLLANGVPCIGLDSEAEDDLETCVKDQARVALVLGAEGKGLRHKTRETCDRLANIQVPGAIQSLNVSNAAALALYIASRAAASG
ncbi:MAG: 23S rRNA (guanosine(2251)-2'-O)-methyltransferase RlmB [Pseudomonadota bacterium]